MSEPAARRRRAAGESNGAEGGTRTPTLLRAPAPQAGASANSATSANGVRLSEVEQQAIYRTVVKNPRRTTVENLRREPSCRTLVKKSTCGVVFVGVAAGAGVCVTGCAAGRLSDGGGGGAPRPPTTDAGPRCPHTASVNAKATNAAARPAVIFVSSVAPARAPNAAWLLPPPNALAMSPPLPCCSRITRMSSRQTNT